jgi:hypothetical protein
MTSGKGAGLPVVTAAALEVAQHSIGFLQLAKPAAFQVHLAGCRSSVWCRKAA